VLAQKNERVVGPVANDLAIAVTPLRVVAVVDILFG
jgi:hypothetical protein